jgi:hypothetical protein
MIKHKIIILLVFLDLHECEIEKEDENEIWLKDVSKNGVVNIIFEKRISYEDNKNEYLPSI